MGQLTPKGYFSRLIENEFKEYLASFGAVEVDGPKWCGKTWTSLAYAESVIHLDDWETRRIVETDISIGLQGSRPRLIDEWQEIPQIRDAVRREIDSEGNRPGSFILTGSTAPSLYARERLRHSGAGRIGRLHMRPMSLYESGYSNGAVSLSGLFNGKFVQTENETGLELLAECSCRGGWPAIQGLPFDRARRVTEQYIDEAVVYAAERAGKNTLRMKKLIGSISRNIGAQVSQATLSSDTARGDESEASARMTRETVNSYLDVLRNIYVLEELEGWDAPVRARARTRTRPKRYLVDPSLAAAALGVSPEILLNGDMQTFGLLFESLCLRDLRVYASANAALGEGALKYYRDDYGLETDVIVERRDGAWGAIKIKLGENKVQDGIDNLLRLKQKIIDNGIAQSRAPSFLMVLVGRSRFSRISPEGVYVVPVTCLGA